MSGLQVPMKARRRAAALATAVAAAAVTLLFVPSSQPSECFVTGWADQKRELSMSRRAEPAKPRPDYQTNARFNSERDQAYKQRASATIVGSVFDGPVGQFQKYFEQELYTIDKETLVFTTKSGKTGKWNKDWQMPHETFKEREKDLWREFRALARKLRKKHGRGQVMPNGEPIYVRKMAWNPFTWKVFGNRYREPAPWLYSEKEVEAREKQMRAKELKRRLQLEEEEKRILRLRKLGVWLGESNWRKPWLRQVKLEA